MTPWTVAHQAPPSMGFSRQEHWSGLPCAPPQDLSHPGIKATSVTSPALGSRFFTTSAMCKIGGSWEAGRSAHHSSKTRLKGWDWGRGVGGRPKREGTSVYLQLIHFVIWQKPSQHFTAILLQSKRKARVRLSLWGACYLHHG